VDLDSAVRLLNLLALVCGVGAMAAAVYLRWRRRSEFEAHMGIAALTSIGLILFVFFRFFRRSVIQQLIARQRAVERQRG
jgi:hypothetical protein